MTNYANERLKLFYLPDHRGWDEISVSLPVKPCVTPSRLWIPHEAAARGLGGEQPQVS